MNGSPRYIVKFRSGRIGYYQQHESMNLLIKCNEDWKHLHVTGWTADQLKHMDYVKSLRITAVQAGRTQTNILKEDAHEQS